MAKVKETSEVKKVGCWSKLKSMFEDRGFDLEYEYSEYNPTGDRSFMIQVEDRKTEVEMAAPLARRITTEDLTDDDLEPVNFNGIFTSNEQRGDEFRRKSLAKRRVSRPSMFLTNITEELDENIMVQVNRSPAPSIIPSAILYAPSEPLELLCVFPERASRVCSAACAAATRVGGEWRTVRGVRETTDAMRRDAEARIPHVIVIDARQPQIVDAIALAKSIRGTKNTPHIILIAVVKKAAYLKDDFAVLSYLEAGFNRVMVETVGTAAWCAELLQARTAASTARAQIAAVAALGAAVNHCRDLVAVADNQQKILLTNKSWSRVLGWGVDDGPRVLADAASGEALRLATNGTRDWNAPIMLRRRVGPETILLPCRGAAVTVAKNISHVVLVCEPMNTHTDTERSRGSLHSIIRRGSLDVRSVVSDGLRRTSLAKLQGLPLDAPIAKVIQLLNVAAEGAPPSTVSLIEQAVDVLKSSSELYSPQMKDEPKLRAEDPIATELIGALLAQGNSNVLSSRRSSNDSTAIRATNRNIKHVHISQVTSQLRDLLESNLSWDFEIFRLEDLSHNRPLVHLGLTLMHNRFDVCSALECDERTLIQWLSVVEGKYHSDNTYHNSTHAADVLQAVAFFLEKDRLKNLLEPLEAAAALIAAAAHDIDHPGTSSMFLCNSRDKLATLYNDISVLESHHAALTFRLTLEDDKINIFKKLDRDSYNSVRHNVIDMILATEMTKHYEHLAKFVNVFYAKSNSKEEGMQTDEPLSLDLSALLQQDNVVLVKRMMIKCADVSNASRQQKFAVEWAKRIAEEYFLQTDKEKANDLPVVMPMFDRTTCSIPRSQIGFIDYIIIDMMEAWAAFIEMPELVSLARSNYARWKELDEAGVTTIEEVMRALHAAGMPPIANNAPLDE